MSFYATIAKYIEPQEAAHEHINSVSYDDDVVHECGNVGRLK